MRRLSILGSTGSIGTNAINVVNNLNDLFDIVYLSAHSNWELLVQQALQFQPQAIAIIDSDGAKKADEALHETSIEVLSGRAGLLELAGRDNVDLMLNGLVGSSGMEPTLRAVIAGVDVALSNKESLVMAGSLITQAQKDHQVNLYPVDSEHSAIWQCLVGEDYQDLKKIILTGSGGPFREKPIGDLANITPSEALNHPNWSMGNKITIDSATMMNKGLEVIEAKWLFNVPASKIEIVVHPQSIIHSMIEFKDGSVKAQLGVPDMKIPIQYALTYPRHLPASWKPLNLIEVGSLTFQAPDLNRFPCIQLAYDVLEKGGSYPAVLNVANEQAVYRFLNKEIRFTDIPLIIEQACDHHNFVKTPDLETILELEHWTTQFVKNYQV